MSDHDLAVKLLELVGGEENVKSVVHCVTRLRYKLKDESIADDETIKAIAEVQGLVKKGGQYQIVLGPSVVDRIHEETLKLGNFGTGLVVEDADEDKGSLFNRFVDLVSGIFTPILGILAASGMIKGFLALFSTIGLIPLDSTTYTIINSIGDTMFYFMPVLIGYYAMKKFGGTPILGAVIGATLVYPAIGDLANAETLKTLFEGTIFQADVKAYLFGIPLVFPMSGYASSVIPIIAINALAAKVEKWSKKVYPDTIALFFIPMTTLLVASIVGLLLVGPVISILSSILTAFFLALLNVAPSLYGFMLGSLWQVLVMFGLHWALIPMGMLEFGEFMAGNTDKMIILAPTAVVSFAQIGAVLAIILKTKDSQLKKIAVPAFITGIFGITEPAIYGVTLPRKKDFILSCLAGGLGGFYVSLMNVGGYTMGGMGIFAILANLNPANPSDLTDFINMAIAIGIAFGSGFLLVYFFGHKEVAVTKSEQLENNGNVISPVVGEFIELSTIDDDIFKNEIMGKTTAIKAASGAITSPINGTIVTVFPTKHAIGIEGINGEEILIHVGIDTVELEGQGFDTKIKVGDIVKQGDKLLDVDFKLIEEKGYDSTVIVVMTNEGKQTYNVINQDDLLFQANI